MLLVGDVKGVGARDAAMWEAMQLRYLIAVADGCDDVCGSLLKHLKKQGHVMHGGEADGVRNMLYTLLKFDYKGASGKLYYG